MVAVHTCVFQTREVTSACVPLVLGFMQTGMAEPLQLCACACVCVCVCPPLVLGVMQAGMADP
jgi:hypothetical protein